MHRQEKINEEVAREITAILRTVKDPRVASAFISISSADVTRDLSYAKIYYGVLGDGGKDVEKGLASASGYIRSELARRLNLRLTPKLIFIKDESTERAIKISRILSDLDIDGENDE